MIAYLRGSVVEKTYGGLVLDVSGVGYFLHMSNASLGKMPPIGHEVAVHAHLHVREDALQLFGFAAKPEKQLFEQLIGVNGIGPKVALAVLSAYEVEPLKRAIVSEDAGIITSIPGIGKKTAQRLILELKEKLAAEGVGMSSPAPGGAAVNGAYDALLALGYSVVEAREALQGFKGEPVVEELIKFALQKLAVRK